MNSYLYDPHVHTKESSRCGWMPATDVVDLYHARNYAGIVITDHMHEPYISALACRDDWNACIDEYLTGYSLAKQRGEEIGLDVLLGMELRFPEQGNDYLIYGIDENFLRSHPYMYLMGHSAFYEAFKDEVLIINAHPFRDGNETVFYESVHGIEIVNCSPRHDNHNELALALCMKNPHLLRTCSSDMHRPGDEARAALVFNHRIRDSIALRSAMLERAYTMQCDEFSSVIEQSKNFFGGANS